MGIRLKIENFQSQVCVCAASANLTGAKSCADMGITMENKINPADVPKKKLYTGEEIPSVGLGTFGSDKYTPQQVSDAVYGAIKSGYRLIDCASV